MMIPRVGLGFDVHPFAGAGDGDGDEGPLVLGGVTFEGTPGLAGHSDADVVAHAVADALLGAAGLPDLGTMFPAGDERYRGADSLALLAQVADRVREEGFSVGNVDVVVAAERPRLGPSVAAMQDNLGTAVGGDVTVKAKAGEGAGAIGRGEAIAAWAVALLVHGGDR